MKSKILILVFISFLLTSFVYTDEGFIEMLTQKFENFNKQNPQVKVHLFFSQDKYSPGDTAFYKAHFLTDGLRPIAGRQILNFEIINADGKIVQRQSFGVSDGVGANQIILSKDLTPGIYLFAAYSEWMKNFSPDYFYYKSISITRQKEITPVHTPANETLTFHPEGGNLISGISNKIVVRFTGAAQVQVIDNSSKEIDQLTLDELGLGSFRLTPEPYKSYAAKVIGQTQLYNLPDATSDGLALMVTPTLSREPLKVLIMAPKNSDWRGKDLYLVVVEKSKIHYSTPIQLVDDELLEVAIPQRNLTPGIAQLVLFNGKGIVLAERLFFFNDQSEIQVDFTTEKKIYAPREKISVVASIKDEFGNPLRVDFAVSVLNKKLFKDERSYSLTDQLLLMSDFSWQDKQSYYNTTLPKESRFASFDNYLITKKWNRFQWPEVMASATKKKKYEFKRTLSIDGIAWDKDTGLPVPDSTLINVYLQSHMMGYEAYTTKEGRFSLPFLFDFWGKDRLFYLMERKKKEIGNAQILASADSMVMPKAMSFNEEAQVDAYGDFKFKKTLVDGSFSFYTSADQNINSLSNPNAEFEDELMGADVSVNVEKYIIFPTMEELIREVIPSLLHRKVGGKSMVRVLLSEASVIPTGDPLFIINGVMTKNTTYFLNLKPADVLTVKIIKDINKLLRFGAMGKNGIVLIQTKKSDIVNLTNLSNVLPVEGLSKSIEFRSPDHSLKSNARIPDFRSTLYWNPSLKTDATGKAVFNFYASDDSGPLVIKLQGVTSDGKPFSKESEVTVVFE